MAVEMAWMRSRGSRACSSASAIVGLHRLRRTTLGCRGTGRDTRASRRATARRRRTTGPCSRGPRCSAVDGPVGEVAVGRHVDLPRPVVLDELQADLGELLPQERLAAREIEVLDRAEVARERADLVEREVVAAVEVPPVEAVLAGQIADRVDEQDQERRRLRRLRARMPAASAGCAGAREWRT